MATSGRGPVRSMVSRLGYLLLAPQIQWLLGRDVFSVGELKARNLAQARMEHLLALGLRAERESAVREAR
jgi:hypothetical protein